MAKRLFFAAVTCCMVICSVALIACSDDDEAKVTHTGQEEGTMIKRLYADGVESVKNVDEAYSIFHI